ncbi:MAG: RimK family alpha-L-glutamate ligase [Myxococcota bacterium]
MKLAWVTCRALPEADEDEPEGIEALRNAGHHVTVAAWDDAGVVWSEFDACLIRSTWNYARQVDAFKTWLTKVEKVSEVYNPPSVIRWNLDKRYLLALRSRGIQVLDTECCEPGDSVSNRARQRAWDQVVVKPAVGAGSWRTQRFSNLDEADAFGRSFTRPFLVQPVYPAFEDPGERCLVWVDGVWSHAVDKRPRFHGEDESVRLGSPPSREELAFGDRVLASSPGPLLYARLDLIHTDAGPRLSELELIEPSLFWFLGGPARRALDRLVQALGTGTRP